jgi:hypothetical protein
VLCRRKSTGKDENAAAAALGFGKKRSLEKSRGMMEMFVRRAVPKTTPASKPVMAKEETPSESPAAIAVCFLILYAFVRSDVRPLFPHS